MRKKEWMPILQLRKMKNKNKIRIKWLIRLILIWISNNIEKWHTNHQTGNTKTKNLQLLILITVTHKN